MQAFLWSAAGRLPPFALRRVSGCILAGCVLAGSASSKTIVFEGDYGLNRLQPAAADVYDATRATVQAEQGTNNTCWNIRPSDSPESALFLGGRCIGVGHNRTMARKLLYDRGNGAGVRAEIGNFTIRRFYSEYAWDPIKPAAGGDRWTIEDSWIRSGRDDCIEADHHPVEITVRRSLMEDCHSWISVRPGGSRPNRNHYTIRVEDSLLSQGCRLDGNEACIEREVRSTYPWSRRYDPIGTPKGTDAAGNVVTVPGTGSGGRGTAQFLKIRNHDQATLIFRNNHVMMGASIAAPGPDGVFYTDDDLWQENGFHTPERNLEVLLQSMGTTVDPSSTGNTFYWLGGCDFHGLTMVELHGACVPREFNLDPAVWTRASNSLAEWLATRAKWVAEVWGDPQAIHRP